MISHVVIEPITNNVYFIGYTRRNNFVGGYEQIKKT